MNSHHSLLLLFTLCSSFIQRLFAFDVEPYPNFRFREFWELTDAEKSAATELGYTYETWNQPGSLYEPGGVEYLSWWYLTNMDYYDKDQDGNYYEPTPGFVQAAETLGFVGQNKEDIWDCWMNHYGSYAWTDIVEYDLESYMTTLGWNEAKWTGTDTVPPDADSKLFNELTDVEKTAALGICYTQKLWDYKALPYCKDASKPIKQNKKNRSCDWVSKNFKRCNNLNGEFLKHCSNTCGVCDSHKCQETKRKFLHKTSDTGTKIYKKCNFVGTNTATRCAKRGFQLTCPATCGSYAGCE